MVDSEEKLQTNKDIKKYPISEIFVSPQGEGVYAGAMMCFIRLAGCTVGKPYPKEMYKIHDEPSTLGMGGTYRTQLPIYTEKCTLYDGREFACDTDYRVKQRLTVQEILLQIPANVRRVCITGGEPCMHDLSSLFTGLYAEGKKIHIETSGTIMFDIQSVWVTVSPKQKCLSLMVERADELKLLVDESFDPGDFYFDAARKPVYLHPVNYEHTVNPKNLQLCVDIQKKYPQYRIGIQLHKAISMLTEEHVR